MSKNGNWGKVKLQNFKHILYYTREQKFAKMCRFL